MAKILVLYHSAYGHIETMAYAVAEGVPFVNGSAVPKDGVVHLTDAEAAFDLGLDRIAPKPDPKPAGQDRLSVPLSSEG